MKKLVRFFNGEVKSSGPSTTTTLSFTMKTVLTVFMFVTWGLGQAWAQNDGCTPSFTIDCPPAYVGSCIDGTDADVTGIPTISGETCGADVEVFSQDALMSSNACSQTYVRTWVATSGEYAVSCTQTIIVVDNVGPQFDFVPANDTIECDQPVPAPATLTATDGCGSPVTITSFVSSNGLGDGLQGQATVCQLTTPIGPGPDGAIWLNGVQAAGLAASNYWVWTGSPLFTSFPDGTAHLVGNVVNMNNAAQAWSVDMWFESRRDWSQWSSLGRLKKDDLGFGALNNNYLSWDFYELVPTFSTLTGSGAYAGNILYLSHQPADHLFGFQKGIGANNRNGNEGMSGWFFYQGWYNGQWRSGNGDLFSDSECTDVNDQCEETTVYMWRAQDACGNNSFASQTIVQNDTTAPVFDNCPESITIECDQEIPAVAEGLTATDNCTAVTVSYIGETSSVDGCTTVITRSWLAADECQNRAICTQTITIVDTTAPSIEAPADYTTECSDEIVWAEPVISDNCNTFTVEYSSEEMEGECPQSYTIVRHWMATDACGNSSEATQYITVVDTTAPVFEQYDIYVSAECDQLDNVEGPSATDNCGEVTIVLTSEILNSGGCLGVLERIYTATDECGNSSTATLYISIQDTHAPVINNPEDMTVECDQVPMMPEISITDNCGGEVTVTTDVVRVDGDCANSYTLLWIWEATDFCENVSSDTTVITVIDTTNPYFTTFPENMTINCYETVPAVVLPLASDNCTENVEVTVTQDTIPGECPQEMTIQRIFRAYDECGNTAMYMQEINIVDNDAPVFDEQPSFYTYECSETVPYIEPMVSDVCGDVTISYTDNDQIESDCYGFVYRTWIAVDECGNSSEFVQTFQIQDTTDPIITAEFELTLPCDDYMGTFATASDNCDEEVEITYTDMEVSGGSCQGRVIRTYTATDECGNTSTFEQFISLIDTTLPTVESSTGNQTYECGSEWPTPVVTFSDNCDNELEYETTSVSSVEGCNTVWTYTFTATDNCDNTATEVVVITIVDTTAPMVYAPQGGEFSCDADINYGWAQAGDVCDEVIDITFSDDTIAGECPNSYQIVRTWYGADDCGNVGEASTTYWVYDNTDPYFTSVPEDYTVECDMPIVRDDAFAGDNCGTAAVTVTEMSYEGECANSYTIVRTFLATDLCGNTAETTQTITVIDTTAPTITAEFELTLPCDDYMGIFATASDNCDETLEITYTDLEVSGGSCQGRVIRTYSVTDDCGNTATFEQFIALIDTTLPTVESSTGNQTYECGSEWPTPVVTFADNCDDELSIVSGVVLSEEGCNTVYTYSYTATDNCNNSVSETVVITIVDTTAPMVYAPQGGEFSCDADINYGWAQAGDVCDEVIDITFSDDTIAGECPNSYQIVRTWYGADDCGNVGEASTTYWVYDNTDPYFTSVPEDYTIECNMPIVRDDAFAGDNCGSAAVTVTEMSYEGECANSYTIVRTFLATDLCGNTAETTQTITVIDTTAPTITAEFEITRPCDDFMGTFATASDNCDETLEITYTDLEVSGGSCEGRVIRTYSVTDDCGNTATFEQFIALIDTTLPTVESSTGNQTYECGSEWPTPVVTFADNCDDELSIVSGVVLSEEGCNTVYTYSYTATDNCNNSVSETVVITIVDTTAPMVYAPQGGEYSCDADINYGWAEAGDSCDDMVDITFADDTIAGECPNSYQIVRTWYGTDNCGNVGEASTTYWVYDETAPTFDSEMSDVWVECYPVDFAPAALTATDACGSAVVESNWNADVDTCGNGVIVVTYVATDLCGNTSYSSYTVHILDETAPELSEMPANMNLECGVEIPEAPVVTATDNCSGNVEVFYEETIIGENPLQEGQVANCEILTPALPANDPCNYDQDWAMALFAMPSAHAYYHIVSGNFVQYLDGTVHVVAQVENNNPAYAGSGFYVDVNFGSAMNWAQWSTQSFFTGFKADCGGVAANHFDWTYFLLTPGAQTELVGYGAYAGSALNLAHAPQSKYFGFQLGAGANNYNAAENGFGGWFTYNGTFLVNNQQVMSGSATGAGDFAFELDCCPDYTIQRCWTAVDCSGNETSYCQTITIDGGADVSMPASPVAPETASVSKGDLEIVNIFPNPATSTAQVKFTTKVNTNVTLDIVDMTGRKVGQIYTGQVDAGVVYNFDVNTSEFGNGLYQVRLVSLYEVDMKQLSVVK